MDRDIPNRSALDCDFAHYKLMNPAIPKDNLYNNALDLNLFGGKIAKGRILPIFKSPRAKKPSNYIIIPHTSKKMPNIQCTRIFDIPNYLDDYYLNAFDLSCEGSLAIALGDALYLGNPEGGWKYINKAPTIGEIVCSISFAPKGDVFAIGQHGGGVRLMNAVTGEPTTWSSYRIGVSRICSLAWKDNDTLAAGSNDGLIRVYKPHQSRNCSPLMEHRSHVCGLKWSPGGHYLASGANDDKLIIWDVNVLKPYRIINSHKASVKALSWNPHNPSLIISGGGTADRRLTIHNIHSGELQHSFDTGSQVTSAHWLDEKHVLSTGGCPGGVVTLWDIRSSKPLSRGIGHTFRILGSVLSHSKDNLVTVSGDETLRFWDIKQLWQNKKGITKKPSVFDMYKIR